MCPSLEGLKARLEQCGLVEAVLAQGRGWNGMSFRSFQLNPPCDSTIPPGTTIPQLWEPGKGWLEHSSQESAQLTEIAATEGVFGVPDLLLCTAPELLFQTKNTSYLDCSKEEHLLGRLFGIQGKKVQAELN